VEAARLIDLSERFRERRFERECEQLRPLGEAYVLRRFSGSLNRADAEDAVSDVVIRLHRRMTAGRAPKNLRAAFFTSVRNAAIDQLRARSVRPTVALEAAGDMAVDEGDPGAGAERKEDSVRLQEALGRMRGNYREAIVLRFGLGLTVPEIAEHLGISLPAAKKLVLRATEQARKRLAAIEGEEFCPEMQELARDALLEKHVSGLASPSEQRILEAHFQHCGACKSFLSNLHRGLNELGGTALLAGSAGNGLGVAGHVSGWVGQALDSIHGFGERLKLSAYKATGVLQGDGTGSAGALATTTQKVVAVCGAATATTATCLATGVIGPGVGITAEHAPSPPQKTHEVVRTMSEYEPASPEVVPDGADELPPSPSLPPASDTNSAGEAQAPAEPAPTPSEAASEEFGFESSASPESVPEPVPAPEPTPAPSAPPSSSAGASSSGGGGEQFGFGG
jgi:RNA polymerase sigma-70 factor, ECF subfamily